MTNRDHHTEALRQHVQDGGNATSYAKLHGLCDRTVRRWLAALQATGYDPENGRYHRNPADQSVSGYSTLVRFPDGDPFGRVLEWVKTNRTIADQLASINRVIESLCEEIRPIDSVQYSGESHNPDLITVIPIGDPHIGLLTWKAEVGEDWDLKIAERVFRTVFARLLAKLPDTDECVLVNTGDFFHADNIAGETSRSKHKLDLDGRHGKWIDAGGVIIVMMLDACLRKYKRVTFVNVTGNHDDIMGRFLGTLSDFTFRNEKRLTVLKGDSPRQYQQRGIVGMGFAHCHLCKPSQLPQAFACDVPEIWGATKLRMYFTGHVHHDSQTVYKDNNGVIVVSAGIIPPRDAYAYGAGYSAHRTMCGWVLDTKRGEIDRMAPVMVRSTD